MARDSFKGFVVCFLASVKIDSNQRATVELESDADSPCSLCILWLESVERTVGGFGG